MSGGDFAVVRYNSDGSLDSSFGVYGIVTIDFGGTYDVGTAVAIDSSDRIVVAGYSYQGATGSDFAVARLTAASGALDTTFDTDRKQTVDFGYGVAVDIPELHLQ